MSAKILVAEDEKMMLKAISFKLQKEGYEVVTAEDGREALDQLEKDNFDVVVTDIMMPYLSGLELVTNIREKNQHIKIILLSSLGQEATVVKAFALGADDYMTKPFSPNELIVRVKKLLMKP